MGIRDAVVGVVKEWANLQRTPGPDEALQALWAEGDPAGSLPDAAQDLANRIDNAFGTDLQGSDINPPGSIKTVDDLVKAVTQ
jgi:hypothetical protein